MVPWVGSIIRLTMRRLVVLPQPEGPTSTVILPVGAVRLSSSTATVPSGNCLVTASNRIMRGPSRGRRRGLTTYLFGRGRTAPGNRRPARLSKRRGHPCAADDRLVVPIRGDQAMTQDAA